ncbi:MAG: N-acyl amino acid synthase of PEP-CTERM/exosortase system [Oleiphilaceae bacterium]|jgi:N-acyl amino acid synthase of PEP-CTERM/exosortase system
MTAQHNRHHASDCLIQGFNQYFTIKRAESQAMLDDIYRIRYGVYCQEFGYEPPNKQGLEQDQFDRYSSHCLLTHKSSGINVGCIRVISLSEENQSIELPFITHCGDSFYPAQLSPETLSVNQICELSRVAVVPQFRRRAGENNTKDGLAKIDDDLNQTSRFPFITPSLYLAAGALFLASNKQQVFVATEPRLIKSLAKLGIRFRQVSELTNYHGQRAVYTFTRQSILGDIQAMPKTVNKFFHFIESQVT